jgi:transcriptional regulator with XRE-family HTH domain
MVTHDAPEQESGTGRPTVWAFAQIGEKVRRLREIKGMKQESVAQELGMTPNGYGKIERGESSITLERLEQIAAVLKISPLDILQFDESTVYHVNTMNSSAPHGIVNNYAMQEHERHILLEQIRTLNELIATQAKLIESLAGKKPV